MYESKRKVRQSLPVQRALELGWKHADFNRVARKYFKFLGPGRFEVSVMSDGSLAFTVGDTTDTYTPAVIARLEAMCKPEAH